MSNDISVFPVALLENAVTGPITYQGEEVRGSPTYVNNSANAWKLFLKSQIKRSGPGQRANRKSESRHQSCRYSATADSRARSNRNKWKSVAKGSASSNRSIRAS